MKPNEDGFYSVEDCVAVLSKPPKFSAVASALLTPLDLRRSEHTRIYETLRGSGWVIRVSDHRNKERSLAHFQVINIIDGCEDFDALIDTLRFISQLNK